MHQLESPHPTIDQLAATPEDLVEVTVPGVESAGWFGLQNTNTNQYVFSAELLRLLEDRATALLGAADLPVAGHSFEKVAAVFKKPFEAGGRYVVRGRLWQDGERKRRPSSASTT